MDRDTVKALSMAHDKLFARLFSKQEELRKLSANQGGNWRRQARLTKLSEEITSLESRLARCERLMEQA